jgi:hypothetical protein
MGADKMLNEALKQEEVKAAPRSPARPTMIEVMTVPIGTWPPPAESHRDRWLICRQYGNANVPPSVV